MPDSCPLRPARISLPHLSPHPPPPNRLQWVWTLSPTTQSQKTPLSNQLSLERCCLPPLKSTTENGFLAENQFILIVPKPKRSWLAFGVIGLLIYRSCRYLNHRYFTVTLSRCVALSFSTIEGQQSPRLFHIDFVLAKKQQKAKKTHTSLVVYSFECFLKQVCVKQTLFMIMQLE